MECIEAEKKLASYALGALEPREKKKLEAHMALCNRCSTEYIAYSETAASLAKNAPQERPNPVLKAKFLQKFDTARMTEGRLAATKAPIAIRQKSAWWPLNGYFAAATVAAIVIGVLGVSIWFDHRLNTLAVENEKLAARMTQQSDLLTNTVQQVAFRSDQGIDRLTRQGAWLVEVAQEQRSLSYLVATPGVSVHFLQASETPSKSRGMMMISPSNKYAILAVLQMEQLPQDKVYQVWLLKGTQRDDGGYFKIDSTGYGQISISPAKLLNDYDSVGITIEPAGGSPWPTGKKVLDGKLLQQ